MSFRFLVLLPVVLFFSGAAYACPDYSQSGKTFEMSGKEFYSKQRYDVRAGGSIDIEKCANVAPRTDRGSGFVTEAPDFTFNLSGMSGYKLVIDVVSQCDSILLVNTASAGWYYDDDDRGNLDPLIELTNPGDGWLDIWIGTHDGTACDAVLNMETFDR